MMFSLLLSWVWKIVKSPPCANRAPLHWANRNEVRRKDDLDLWLAMNNPGIGGFGVP